MIKVGDKIKVSNINVILVYFSDPHHAKVIYKDNGYRIIDDIIFIDGLWKFEIPGVSGKKLKDSEYTDFII
ncbi:hypothetical protein IT400_01015 [Candidatus Nomurabacteria bacterium]|nr:hypothetical protein [Candidatus Nomurabacteria bacterium]